MHFPAESRMLTRAEAQRRGGVTLFELIAVVAILAILITLVFPAIYSVYDKLLAARCIANTREFGIAMLGFAADNGGLPPKPVTNVENIPDNRPGSRTIDWQGWYKEFTGKKPPRCPLMPTSGPEANRGFYYTGNTELLIYYPKLLGIPVPPSRVALIAERNYGSGFNDKTHFNGTIWGTGTGLPSGGKEEGSGSGPYPSKPHYHGSKEHRGLHFFFLDGHAKLLTPVNNDWGEAPIYGVQTQADIQARQNKEQDIGYFYDQRHFSRMFNGTLIIQ